jgi:uncharacterized protein YebE (UPF0316 family)
MHFIEPLFAGPFGPLVIFGLRIVDVSLSTVRILLAVRGHRMAVPFIGFFEVLLWVFAAGNAIRYLESGWHVLGYAAGFSTGSIVGLRIEQRLAIGYATIRVISRRGGVALADALRAAGFGVTEFAAHGRDGPVEVIYSVCMRRDIPRFIGETERWDSQAFITVEEPREIRWGWMQASPRTPAVLGVNTMFRKLASRIRRNKET